MCGGPGAKGRNPVQTCVRRSFPELRPSPKGPVVIRTRDMPGKISEKEVSPQRVSGKLLNLKKSSFLGIEEERGGKGHIVMTCDCRAVAQRVWTRTRGAACDRAVYNLSCLRNTERKEKGLQQGARSLETHRSARRPYRERGEKIGLRRHASRVESGGGSGGIQ